VISICGLVPYPLNIAPSQRYRIEQWLPSLANQGISVNMMPFASDELMQLLHKPGLRLAKARLAIEAFLKRIQAVATAGRYDAVLVHRAACLAGPAVVERLIAMAGVPIIFDFDDAIYLLHTTEANQRLGWLKFPGKTGAICRVSDQIVVGNSFLADYARRYNPRVTVVPTSVDTDRYRPVQEGERRRGPGSKRRMVVGWMGSSTSQTYLEMFAPVLVKMLKKKDVELRVVSDRKPDLPGVNFTWRPWSAESEVDELAEFDIGIMPMPDDMWSRGKCSLKALLYMAMGLPAVCSAVGANLEVISHGESGILASTADEWVASIEELIADAELRQRLGAAARKTVEARYSMDVCSSLFGSVVRRAVGAETRTTGEVSCTQQPKVI
jgi:glycosyltransferase involved in cell wall biosynthesis